MDNKYDYQKLPSVERMINAIDTAKDQKVRIIGTVIAKDENSFIIDDGTGTIKVSTKPEMFDVVNEKQVVRVIGRPMHIGSSLELQADIVQDMSKMNMKFYKIVHEKWKEQFGKQP